MPSVNSSGDVHYVSLNTYDGDEAMLGRGQDATMDKTGDHTFGAATDMASTETKGSNLPERTITEICGLNAFGFSYGLLIATYGVITLPTEAERMVPEKEAVMLALFLALAGVSQLIGPIAGFFSDGCTHRWGRRRPFLIFGGVIGCIGLFVQWWARQHLWVGLYLVSFFGSMLCLTVMYTAFSGAVIDLVPEKQLGQVNGVMGAFAVLGASSGFGAFSKWLSVESGYLFYAVTLVVTVAISVWFMDEAPVVGESRDWAVRDLWRIYYVSPVHHRDFFLVFLSRTQYYMGISVQAFMFFYFRDLITGIEPKEGTALLALCGQLAGAVVCYPMGLLSDRCGRKPLIYVSCAVIVVVYICFMFTRTLSAVLITGMAYGIGNGTYLAVDYALACDTLPSKDNAARFLGIWGVAAFVGTMMGPLIVGPFLIWFGGSDGGFGDGSTGYMPEGYMAILVVGCLCMTGNALTITPVKAR